MPFWKSILSRHQHIHLSALDTFDLNTLLHGQFKIPITFYDAYMCLYKMYEMPYLNPTLFNDGEFNGLTPREL